VTPNYVTIGLLLFCFMFLLHFHFIGVPHMQVSAQTKAMALRNQAEEEGLGTFELSSKEYPVVCSTEEGILKVALCILILLESYRLAFVLLYSFAAISF
jgi:hypothetical protein